MWGYAYPSTNFLLVLQGLERLNSGQTDVPELEAYVFPKLLPRLLCSPQTEHP